MSLQNIPAGRILKTANPQIEMSQAELKGSFRFEILDFENDGKHMKFTVAGCFDPEEVVELADVHFMATTKNSDALQGVGVSDTLPDYNAVLDVLAIGLKLSDGKGLFAPVVPSVDIRKEMEMLCRFLTLGWTPPAPSAPAEDQVDAANLAPAIPINVGLIAEA